MHDLTLDTGKIDGLIESLDDPVVPVIMSAENTRGDKQLTHWAEHI